MRLRIIAPDGGSSERVVTVAIVRFGRDAGCEIAFDPNVCPMVSGEHARIEKTEAGLPRRNHAGSSSSRPKNLPLLHATA